MSSQVTLHAKQAEARALQDQVAEFLASGGQTTYPDTHNGKAQPFNQGHALSEKTVEGTGFNRREHEKKITQRAALYRRGENHRANILGFMRQSGQSVTVADIAEYMGMSVSSIQHHITFLGDKGLIKPAGKRRYARLYEVAK